jgi:hypothetical protein
MTWPRSGPWLVTLALPVREATTCRGWASSNTTVDAV